MDESVWALEEKVRKCRPEVVCIVGKSIWESIWRARHGRAIKKDEFRYGWQDGSENMGTGGPVKPFDVKEEGLEDALLVDGDGNSWKGAKVFVATSTSGLAASSSPAEKERIWRELGVWVEERRKELNMTVKEEAGDY
jgi:TDG/mug DNA glycosylase family protein